jgi:hypothetical protein
MGTSAQWSGRLCGPSLQLGLLPLSPHSSLFFFFLRQGLAV